jgi:hypothetical protein
MGAAFEASSVTSKMIRSTAAHSMFKICFSRIYRSGLYFVALGILSLLTGCGGGGAGSPAQNGGDFSISAAPTTLALGAGDSQTVAVSAAGINGFTASISVSVSGLPSGVTFDPATFSLVPGNQQQLTLTGCSIGAAGYGDDHFSGYIGKS